MALLSLLLLTGTGLGAPKGTSGPIQARGADAAFVPGELIVQLAPGASTRALSGMRVIEKLGAPGLVLVETSEGASVLATAATLARDPRVVFAEPNYIRRYTQIPPNDPRYGELWGLNQVSDADIDAPEAWATTTGSSTVIVGVVDSGVAYGHPDLAGNIWVNDDDDGDDTDDDNNGFIDDVRGWDFVQEDNTPLDYNGHGTHVSGTIGAVGNNARRRHRRQPGRHDHAAARRRRGRA